MRVDPLFPRSKPHTIVLEAVGDEQLRVNHSSLDSPLMRLTDQALEVVNIEGQLRVAPGGDRPNTLTSTRWASRPRATGRRRSETPVTV
jgi:hypothetical protein